MTYSRLRYHLILTTKNRRPCIADDVESFIYDHLADEALKLNSKLILMGGVEDHIHSIAAIHRTIAVSDFLRDIKKQTTKAVRKEFPHLKNFEWSVGFGAFTVNPYAMSELWGYIEKQKEHHAKGTLLEEYELAEMHSAQSKGSNDHETKS